MKFHRAVSMLAICVTVAGGFVATSVQAAEKIYRVGLLAPGADGVGLLGPGVVQDFAERGYVQGRNVVFLKVAARGDVSALPALAKQLAQAKVDVILTLGYPPAAAAKQYAPSIPVVVIAAGDPVATGLIESLSHPGGHVTGVSDLSSELSAKRLQLLKEAVPAIHTVAVLWNLDDVGMTLRYRALQLAAPQLGLSIVPLGIRAPDDFSAAFDAMVKHPPDALMMVTDIVTNLNHQRIVDFANAHHLPTIFEYPNFVTDGGMMSYGPSQPYLFERGVSLADHILKGAKPADLPAELPTTFDLNVNMKTVHSLGVTLPPSLIAQATHIIE